MIVMLNGTSSSGKTALARALQLQWPRPLLHLGTDTMLQMLPQPLVGMKPSARDGFEFYEDSDERGAVVRVRRGPVGTKLEEGFAQAARLLGDRGHDLVLDLVLLDGRAVRSYVRALHGHPTYLIGVFCDLNTLEARELARGDRFHNFARAQRSGVHEYREFYDFEVDTSTTGPQELAHEVLTSIESEPEPRAISALHLHLGASPDPRRPTRGCS